MDITYLNRREENEHNQRQPNDAERIRPLLRKRGALYDAESEIQRRAVQMSSLWLDFCF